ncbi:MAG: hypothetical protein ACREGI_01295, partial [Candidatus Levyibacteriota bacterium]
MRHITGKKDLIFFLLITALALWLVGGIKLNTAASSMADSSITSVVITSTPGSTALDSSLQLQQLQIQTSTGPGLHGAFIISNPSEVDLAHNLGVTYAINYNYGGGWANGQEDVNPNSATGKEMAKFNMKTFVGVNQFISDSCTVTDINGIKALVQADMHSPLLAGYWIK